MDNELGGLLRDAAYGNALQEDFEIFGVKIY